MVKHLGSSLVDVMYIFDEPSVGLHPRDVHRLNELLAEAARQGQHGARRRARPDVIKVADHIVDVGPRRGQRRRRDRLRGHATPSCRTSGHADRRASSSGRCRSRSACATPSGKLPIRDARAQQPARTSSVDIPTGVLTVDHRRRRLGQELADRRGVPARASRGDRDRPVGGRHVDALEPGDLHRRHGRRAQGVRGGQQGRRRAVQLQLQGRVRELQGPRA